MIMCGAAPLSFELNQRLFELLPDAHIGQAYGELLKWYNSCEVYFELIGMTETSTATIMWPITRKRGTPGSKQYFCVDHIRSSE